ncbi:MAG: glucose 1-dehydrogenase [Acidobacteria bacterium]|nr:MAG: glucose 1-dehydrogenase [Acidobacteriota bacterium]
MISLRGQTAVITGASRGIGAATALTLARAGANVIVNYRQNRAAAQQVVARARALGVSAFAVKADVSLMRGARRVVEKALSQFGRLDILVANAGIWEGAPIDRLNEELWDRVIRVNLRSVYTCCHLAAQVMKSQGEGKMVLVSSTAGQRGEANYSCYAAAKGAIISFTKSISVELAPSGIRVNCVAPGWVETDMAAAPLGDPRRRREILSQIPIGRVAEPEDVAGVILFLVSDLARHLIGEVVNVNGGSVLCG